MPPSDDPTARLARLQSYLTADPANTALVLETTEAALAARAFPVAADLLTRLRQAGPLDARARSLEGLAAMGMGDFASAAEAFGELARERPDEPAIRFNLAWSLAMTKRFEEALGLISPDLAAALPQAAMLEVQLLHELRQFDAALARAKVHIETHPGHPGLMASVSVLAVDVEDLELAAACAAQGGELSDAQTTLGTIALGEDRADLARAHFEKALSGNPNAPRALIGIGLTALLSGAPLEAARQIERGATLFEDHLGSWLAAGWARLIAGEYANARRHFEHALSIDDTFAESHGSLGVVAAIEGDVEEAKRRTDISLRLDRHCFSGALARALLQQARGNADVAQAIIERALHTPIDASGKTIAQSLAKQGLFA
ncbi:MAG TPA: tetratricopeptide repeat protein [Vitreimonas sp.]|uniref:tetratricopeptide repeat protein n=1 Tax=Vitreimonas sp. TaxID=3069702 RepID=UPI002D34F782|nr:tetratricopeptide repeat protein [Vitreimonas sp.]HYD85978.1 tetratricopeptide repeat protein [Vitreimonas sp.]